MIAIIDPYIELIHENQREGKDNFWIHLLIHLLILYTDLRYHESNKCSYLRLYNSIAHKLLKQYN